MLPRWIKGLRLAAVCLGLLATAFWLFQISAVQAIVRASPQAAAAVAPNDPRARAAVAASELPMGGGAVSEASIDSARASVRQAPLAAEPFLVLGLDALNEGSAKRAEALLLEARHRNPRLRAARFALLELYLRQNKLAEAGTELVVLRRLVPRIDTVLIQQLAGLVRDRGSAATLLTIFRQDPGLHEAVLAAMVEKGADLDLILSMTPQRMTRDAPWQQALVNRLISRGDVRRAHDLWLRFSGLPASGGEKGIHDGAFRGRRGTPPFGWALAATEAGVADISKGALEVQFFGRENADLASQLLLLSQGAHRLRFEVEGDVTGDDGGLSWRILCEGNQRAVAEIPLRDINSGTKQVSTAFKVPAGCGAQWLRLVGEAGEFPQTRSVTIRNLEVTSGG
jgi:hypothetical protein